MNTKSSMKYFLFDIGGTYTRMAVSADGKTIEHTTTFPTPAKPSNFIKEAQTYLKEFPHISLVAGGIRGVLNEEKNSLEHDAILTEWIDFPLQEKLMGISSSAVRLENDAVLAGLGEAIFGAGKGVGVVVYHDISTGVGGAKITNGKIDDESVGIEPGHQVLDIDRTILGDDIVPTLENLVSGRAVEERMGAKPIDIPADDVIWNELAGYLAQGLRNSILYWAPEMIILGGSMMTGSPHISLEQVRKQTVAVLGDIADSPFITLSSLKTEAGLYGALALCLQTK